MKRNLRGQGPERCKGRAKWLLLGAAAVVVAAGGALLALYPPWQPSRQEPAPTETLGQEVLAKAQTAIAAGRPDVARDLMMSYVRTHPGDVEVRMLLARTHLKLNDARSAEATVNAILRNSPTHAEALWLKGELLRARGQDGSEFFRAAAEGPAATARIWALWGAELLRQGKDDEARKFLQRAADAGIKLPPGALATSRSATSASAH
ncbi:MAG: tetratricopeptide repeat protein [Phycisphaerae bacterium]